MSEPTDRFVIESGSGTVALPDTGANKAEIDFPLLFGVYFATSEIIEFTPFV